MKPARIAVLAIALLAGGIAAFLAGRSEPTPTVLAPVVQLETVDILIANVDIGMGHAVSGQELRWQTWPTAAAGPLVDTEGAAEAPTEDQDGGKRRGMNVVRYGIPTTTTSK
jgi:pilus assembly protein CpaB